MNDITPPDRKRWRHEEIAQLLGSLVIKTCGAFLEAPATWTCPACRRSKAQIVAPGRNVNVVARVVRHHDHIENLIGQLLSGGAVLSADERRQRHDLGEEMCRRFCRFEAIDVCEACNTVDAAAKAIVQAPRWFSFSPHGIGSMIKAPQPYAVRHEIDRCHLDLIWNRVSVEIEGLEARICRAIDEAMREAKHG